MHYWCVFILLLVSAFLVAVSTAALFSDPLPHCEAGYCATDVYSGNKICPGSGGSVRYFPGREVCNPPSSCESPLTPFALNMDGSATSATCEEGVTCSCVSTRRCPDYVVSVFSGSGQRPASSFLDSGEMCSVDPSWLAASNPGCSFMKTSSQEEIATCMGLSNGCSGQTSSACLYGTLAYVGDKLACVEGRADCECGTIVVYDENLSSLKCQYVNNDLRP